MLNEGVETSIKIGEAATGFGFESDKREKEGRIQSHESRNLIEIGEKKCQFLILLLKQQEKH